MRNHVARVLGVLVLYGSLVAWLTWPLAASLRTHLPFTEGQCAFDTLYSAWALSWESHALVTDPRRIAEANIYAPTPHALFYGPTAFGALPYFAPIFLATGDPALAVNLLFLGGVALTAASLHLVVAAWTATQVAGLVAGSTFLTARWVLWDFIPTTPHFAVLHYLPWIVFVTATPTLGRRAALALLVLVVLQYLVEPIYVAPAVMAPLGCLMLARVARRATRGDGLRLAGVLVVAGLAIAPVLAGYWAVRVENPSLGAQTLWRVAQTPTALPWEPLGRFSPTSVQPIALMLISIGAASFALSARRASAMQRRLWTHAALWTVAGLAISLTPTATWYGRPIALPHALLARWLPISGVIRVPGSLSRP